MTENTGNVQKLRNVTSDSALMCVFNRGMRISVLEANYADSRHPPAPSNHDYFLGRSYPLKKRNQSQH